MARRVVGDHTFSLVAWWEAMDLDCGYCFYCIWRKPLDWAAALGTVCKPFYRRHASQEQQLFSTIQDKSLFRQAMWGESTPAACRVSCFKGVMTTATHVANRPRYLHRSSSPGERLPLPGSRAPWPLVIIPHLTEWNTGDVEPTTDHQKTPKECMTSTWFCFSSASSLFCCRDV